jgi:uncharacterized membrane protein YeaQ/YmgE (transglycosylase-associated protein family)
MITLRYLTNRPEQSQRLSTITAAVAGASVGAVVGLAYSHTNVGGPLLGTVIGAAIGAVAAFVSRKNSALYPLVMGAIALAALVVALARNVAGNVVTLVATSGLGIISYIILGLIAGFIGSKIVDSQDKGFWLDIVLGIVGALVGGFLFDLFGPTVVTGLSIYSMIVAIIGATVVLLVYEGSARRHS